jgi:hypothetical protein
MRGRHWLAPRHRDDAKYRLRDKTIDQPGEFVLPRHRASSRFALVFAAMFAMFAVAVAGCSNSMFDKNEGGWFSKPVDIFAKPDWARPGNAKPNDLDNNGPVGPDDFVGADGRCGAVMAQAPAPAAPADSAVGTMAGDPRHEPSPVAPAVPIAADAGAPPVLGGIALGMTECQAVQRAGLPGNFNISAGDKGERQVVLSYLSGPWPGIYHFSEGRLKEIDRAPAPPAPPKAPPKKKTTTKKPASAKTSQREIERVQ